jgi:beta-lactam-binding protein with PASTA domain
MRRWRRRIAIVLALIVLGGLGAAAAIEVPRLTDDGKSNPPAAPAVPPGVSVPNVIGEPLDIAESELQDAGFETERYGGGFFGVLVPSDWDVCDMSPTPGERAKRGTTVSLLIDRPDVC